MAEKKNTKHERSDRNDRPASSVCNRCGCPSPRGTCEACVDQVQLISALMRHPRTRPMTATELDILVAKEGRVRGVLAPDPSN
jgi:hypothetical protein